MSEQKYKPAISPPKFDESDSETSIDQLLRFVKFCDMDDAKAVDFMIITIGNKAAKFYSESDWPPLTEEEKSNNVTQVSKLAAYLKIKFGSTSNALHERVKLFQLRQNPSERLHDYVSRLRQIVNKCEFPDNYQGEALRDAFCVGLYDETMRKTVLRAYAAVKLSGAEFTIDGAVNAAEVEQSATLNAEQGISQKIASSRFQERSQNRKSQSQSSSKCSRCGFVEHYGKTCPALKSECRSCHKIGHFESCCRSRPNNKGKKSDGRPKCPMLQTYRSDLSDRRFVDVTVNDCTLKFLIDSGSDITIVEESVIKSIGLRFQKFTNAEARGIFNNPVKIVGKVETFIEIDSKLIPEVIYVAKKLCDSAILGTSTLKCFSELVIAYGGSHGSLKIASGSVIENHIVKKFPDCFNVDNKLGLNIEPQTAIRLLPDTKPIRTQSRRQSPEIKEFVRKEVDSLLERSIIEKSKSPWRAQVVVAKNKNKLRMCIDYASTINSFSEFDAYPMPAMDDILEKIGRWKYFTVLDLKGAFNQIPLPESERQFTAFEANGELYQFRFVPFGITNGVPVCQRVVQNIFSDFSDFMASWVDDLVIGGVTKAEHDERLSKVLTRAKEANLVFNPQKCSFGVKEIVYLGHTLTNGQISPDPERLKPLLEYPEPTTFKALERLMGMLVYYSKWVKNFAGVSTPLFEALNSKTLPLNASCLKAVEQLKREIASAQLTVPNDTDLVTLETDASCLAVGGYLSQNGRPIAFVSHKLNAVEKKWSTVEQEAYAIVYCVEKLRPFLVGRKFRLLTDQQSVSYIFSSRPKSKIKNGKITRWRLELAEYSFDIEYRPGSSNVVADSMSRIADCPRLDLKAKRDIILDVHSRLGHPGIEKTYKFMQQFFNWSGLRTEVGHVINSCKLCAEVKPQFQKVEQGKLISSSGPWQRLSIDFMGPKPTCTGRRYILTCVDEYSRYPFAFACSDMTDKTVIECLEMLFCSYGPVKSVHSDRGRQFESSNFANFLSRWNVSKSRTTPYHPAGNGQCEHMNGTLWKTLTLRCRDAGKHISKWEEELPYALSNIRSVVSIATGETPHNRLFKFQRNSSICSRIDDDCNDNSSDDYADIDSFDLPSWPKAGNNAYLKKHVRRDKNDDKVFPVRILSIKSPHVAEVCFLDDENSTPHTVSIRHLARGVQSNVESNAVANDEADELWEMDVVSVVHEEDQVVQNEIVENENVEHENFVDFGARATRSGREY